MNKFFWFFGMGAAFCTAVFFAAALSDHAALTAFADNGPASVETSAYGWSEDEEWRAKQALIAWEESGTATPEEKDLIERYYWMREGQGVFSPLDNQGGPDDFGYRFVDNVAPDTATFAWIELDNDPNATNITFPSRDDAVSGLLPLGFSFPFYGVGRDSFRVGTNGHIQFITSSTSLSNACLPSTAIAGPVIFPLWDDLHLDRGGDTLGADVVRYRNFGSYTVIQFDSIGFYNSGCVGEVLRFQAVLFSTGRIKMQYHTLSIPGSCQNSQTIGIQSAGAAGSAALTYVCNTTGIQPASGRAIWFYPTPPLANNFRTTSVQSPTGMASPGQVLTVAATFQNAGSNTQSAPVRYRFNNGPTVSEATPVLAQWAVDVHTFATTITAPAAPGAYTLRIWTDLATDQNRSDDTLTVTLNVRNCPDVTITAPGSTTGNTCGAGNLCNLRTSEDRIVRVNIPATGEWTFALCVDDPVWDSYMYLTTECCGGTTIALNDDACPETGVGHPMIVCQQLNAGTYYVDVEAFGSACGEFTLTVTSCGAQVPPDPDTLAVYFTPALPAPVNLPNRGIKLTWTPGTGAPPAAYYVYQAPAGGTEHPPSEFMGAVEWAAEEGMPELFLGVDMNAGEFRNNRYHVTASDQLPAAAEVVFDPNISAGTVNVPSGTTVVALRFVWTSGPYNAASNYTWHNNLADAARWRGNTAVFSDRKRVTGQVSSRKQYFVVANTTPGCIVLSSRFYDTNGNFLVQVSRTVCFQ